MSVIRRKIKLCLGLTDVHIKIMKSQLAVRPIIIASGVAEAGGSQVQN